MPAVDPLRPHLESYLQQQVRDFLVWRRWRIIRHSPLLAVAKDGSGMPEVFSRSSADPYEQEPARGKKRVIRSGEKGMPDLQAIYYFPHAVSCTLWVETKQHGKPLRPDQVIWHDRERSAGAEVWKVDDLAIFMREYQTRFGWIHKGSTGRGQRELLFADFPPALRPTG
jgi:hypothetical protein